MGADRLIITGLADQLKWSSVLEAFCFLFFVLFLPLIICQSLELFDHTDNLLIFGHIVCYTFPDYRLFFALRTNKHFPIALDHQLEYDTFLAEGMTAPGYNPGDPIVKIILLMAGLTMWCNVFSS